ncbi:hypothetical protein WISP_121674 [Willisornis vidua]|uniref:Reverse transcriptase domain-containing protein n=1 Tax=Willisornis vidua TaxID=1566151 RepID=A0ABQ9CYM0_9PASS|nr:hypothetical protein WISP_121674 [Willisornis vidua]
MIENGLASSFDRSLITLKCIPSGTIDLTFMDLSMGMVLDFMLSSDNRISFGECVMKPVTSGDHQGLVLGPILFNIFVGNMESSGIECTLGKFSDNINLCVAVDTLEGRNTMQRDHDTLERMVCEFTAFLEYNEGICLQHHLPSEKSSQPSLAWESHWMPLLTSDHPHQHLSERTQALLNALGLVLWNETWLVSVLEHLTDERQPEVAADKDSPSDSFHFCAHG